MKHLHTYSKLHLCKGSVSVTEYILNKNLVKKVCKIWADETTFIHSCYEWAFEELLGSLSRFFNFQGQKYYFQVDFDCHCCTSDMSRNHFLSEVHILVCMCRDKSVTGFTGASALHHGKGQPCCLLVCLQCCTGGWSGELIVAAI